MPNRIARCAVLLSSGKLSLMRHLSLLIDLKAAEVQMTVAAIVGARKAYLAYKSDSSKTTPLTVEVDAFISLADETRALANSDSAASSLVASLNGLNISGNPVSDEVMEGLLATFEGMGIIDDDQVAMIVGLTNKLGSLNFSVERPWPPAHFPVVDMAVLATGSVVKTLGGIDSHNPGLPVQPGSVYCSSPPADLRIALCRLALVNYTADKDWALFLNPVGYLSRNLRDDWHETLGAYSKVFATINRFLDYASEAMASRGKAFVVGMLTHWLLQPGDVGRVADRKETDALDIWIRHPTMRRYGTILVLRRVSRPDGDQVQLIWHDPWHQDEDIQKMYGPRKTSIFESRAAVAAEFQTWAANKAVRIHSRYWGGHISGGAVVAGDSVKASLEFLDQLLVSGNMEGVFPAPDDKAGFLQQGFCVTEG